MVFLLLSDVVIPWVLENVVVGVSIMLKMFNEIEHFSSYIPFIKRQIPDIEPLFVQLKASFILL